MSNSRCGLVIGIFLFLISPLAKGDDQVRLLSSKTYSRLVVRVDETVEVEWKNLGPRFELLLKGLSLTDLGAPLGEEDAWVQQFSSLIDSRVASLEIMEKEGGVKVTGKWKFPTGKMTLAHPVMESFNYREKSPSQYVVDFWLQSGPTLAEVEASRHRADILNHLKKTQEEERKRVSSRIASEKKTADAENFSRFCGDPLDEKKDVFLKFYPVHEKFDFTAWLPSVIPDVHFPYFRPTQSNKDAQYVRLALDLYAQGKPALTIRALDFLDSEFPKSDFHEEMKFLRANASIKLGMDAEGERVLNEILHDAKGSPAALHAGMFLVSRLMKSNQPLRALKDFLWLIENYPSHPLNWVFHLGAAECLYSLGQTDSAAKEYRWVMEKAPDDGSRAEGSFRVGDLYLAKFQYEQALAVYYQSFKYLKNESNDFPGFFLNQGEILYQLGQFDRSKKVFEKFNEDFPSYPEGWRAAFRLGEIWDRLPRTSETQKNAREWYTNTINRYPRSPGATLARIRIIPCGDHGGFDLDSEEKFFNEEAKNFDDSKSVVMKNYPDFRALSHIRGLITQAPPEKVIDETVQELPRVKNPEVREILIQTANGFFRKIILALLAQGKKYEALSFYSEKVSSIPQSNQFLDRNYVLLLSQVAADFGLGELSQDLYTNYDKFYSQQESNKNQPFTLDRDLRFKISEKNFIKAHAMWINSRNSNSDSNFDQIRKILSDISEESKYSYEKEIILGLIDEKEGKLQSAILHGAQAQVLNSSVQLDAWIASLYSRVGNLSVSLSVYRNLENRIQLRKNIKDEKENYSEEVERMLGIPFVPTLDRIILEQGRILEQQGKWEEAAETYSRGIEKGVTKGQILYAYAKDLMKSDLPLQKSKAKEALEKLVNDKTKDSENDFWKKLAQETLDNQKSEQSVAKIAKEGKNE